MSKITNKLYRGFLDSGLIEIISEEHLKQALLNVNGIRGKHREEGRALLLTLYYTGCRPIEALRLKAKSIEKKAGYIIINMPAAKRGLARPIYLSNKNPLVNEIYAYSCKLMPEMVLFYHYRSTYQRQRKLKRGGTKEATEMTDKLRYFFKAWFRGVIDISPYYLRHNRFSKLSIAGASADEIRQIKGSKTYDSITPYLHLSSKAAKNIAKKIE